MTRLRWSRGDTAVLWADGAVVVSVGGDVLLIDAPASAHQLDAALLGRVRAIVCTGGRVRSVGGLVPLLCTLERHRAPQDGLVLYVPLGEERAAMLAEVWTRGWPDRYPLTIDALRPGSPFDVGAVQIETAPVPTADVRWATGDLEAGVGLALRLVTPDARVAVVLGAGPGVPGRDGPLRPLSRWSAGADLAIVEVGVTDVPRGDRPWRLRRDEGVAWGAGAAEVWLVGDDGAPVVDATA